MRVLKKDELAFVAGGLFGEGGRGGHGGNGGAGGAIINAASGGLGAGATGGQGNAFVYVTNSGFLSSTNFGGGTAAPAARAAPVREPYELKGMPTPLKRAGVPG